MYRITGYFKEHKVVKYFDDIYDAIDFRDVVDANYPLNITFEKGIYPVRTFIYDSWNGVMNANMNPLKNIPDTNVRHMVLQILAWMWCICFGMMVGSIQAFGISLFAHAVILAAIVITVATFELAKSKPSFFLDKKFHTPSRARSIWVNGKRVDLPAHDKGGEHE